MNNSKIVLESINKDTKVSLEIIEVNKIQEDSFKIKLDYESLTLTGVFTSWIDYNSFKEFIKELNSIEKIRSGKAEFESMSPNETKITIENYDSSGHFWIKIKAGKTSSFPKNNYTGLEGLLDIGSEYFNQTIEKFRELELSFNTIELKIIGMEKYGKNF